MADKRYRRWYTDKRTLSVYLVLRALVVLTAAREAVRGDWESVFICGFTLALLILPGVAKKSFRVTLPNTLEIVILLFIFSAEIHLRIPLYHHGPFQQPIRDIILLCLSRQLNQPVKLRAVLRRNTETDRHTSEPAQGVTILRRHNHPSILCMSSLSAISACFEGNRCA